MMKVNAFNPAATSVAFGSSNRKPVKVNSSMARTGEELVEQTAKRPSFIKKVLLGATVLATTVFGSCQKDPDIVKPDPPNPPTKTVALTDSEFMKMMRNTMGATDAEVAAGAFVNDTVQIQSPTGEIVGMKKIGREGDSIVYRGTSYTIDSNGQKYITGVGVKKYYRAAGDAEGTIAHKRYYSPTFNYNDPKMKLGDAIKLITKDNVTKASRDGIEYLKLIPEIVGERINEFSLIAPNELPGKIIRLSPKK